jgi:Anti-sigma factor NepR
VDDNKQDESQPTIGRQAQDRIGRELRALYGPLLEQPLPDAMSAVLGALEDFEAARHHLQNAVQNLRASATASGLSLTPRPTGLSVHAQQMLVTRSMLHARVPGPGLRHRRRGVRAGH